MTPRGRAILTGVVLGLACALGMQSSETTTASAARFRRIVSDASVVSLVGGHRGHVERGLAIGPCAAAMPEAGLPVVLVVPATNVYRLDEMDEAPVPAAPVRPTTSTPILPVPVSMFDYLDAWIAGRSDADLTHGAIAELPGYGVPDGAIDEQDFAVWLAIAGGAR